jgi:outer membrane protein assembly factor BamB
MERNQTLTLITCGLIWIVCSALPSTAQDWPQWRGPNRAGVAVGTELPDALPESFKPVWDLDVGAGHAAPVVVGERLVVMVRQAEQEVVLCLNALTGKELWRDAYDAPYKPQSVAAKHGKGPFATPTIQDGRVYTCGISNILSAYDLATGKRIWRQHYTEGYKRPQPIWGTSNSPLIEGNVCIVGIGTEQGGGLVGLNLESGAIVWKLDIDGPGYASPVVAEIAGERQVITLMEKNLVGLAPKSGAALWQVPFRAPYDQNVLTANVVNDVVFISGTQMPAIALRLQRTQTQWHAEELWSNKAAPMYMSSPVVYGKHLFGLSQRKKGSFICVALENGKITWSSSGRRGDYASIVRAGAKLLILTNGGELVLLAADPSAYRELGRVRVTDRPVWAHLTVAGGKLYVKDKTRLLCLSY